MGSLDEYMVKFLSFCAGVIPYSMVCNNTKINKIGQNNPFLYIILYTPFMIYVVKHITQ